MDALALPMELEKLLPIKEVASVYLHMYSKIMHAPVHRGSSCLRVEDASDARL